MRGKSDLRPSPLQQNTSLFSLPAYPHVVPRYEDKPEPQVQINQNML